MATTSRYSRDVERYDLLQQAGSTSTSYMEEHAYGLGYAHGLVYLDECLDHDHDSAGPAPRPTPNPYPGGHALHAAWRDGWRDSQ